MTVVTAWPPTVAPLPHEQVGAGIWCVETGLYRPGLAACYLLRSADRLAVIDTGTERTIPGLLAVIDALGLTPAAVDLVMPTHVHLDHGGGAGALLAACPNATLVVHPNGAPHLIDPSRLIAGATAVYGEAGFAEHFGGLTPVPEARVHLATDGETFDLAGRRLRFIDTPGHANHHGCILDEATGGCFTGDTFGIGYREFHTAAGPWLFPPTTPVAFDPEAWHGSLDRLMALGPRAMYLTHFGRVDAPERLVAGLHRDINALAALARPEEGRADAGRVGRLRAALTEYLVGAALAHGVPLSPDAIAGLLEVDLELNAQGLDIWLKRRERRAAEG